MAKMWYASRSPCDRTTEIPIDVDDIISQPIMPTALIRMDSAYLKNKETHYLLPILQWAVKNNCPESNEDMWECELIENGEEGLESAIFFAIENDCDSDTLESLFE